VARDTYLSFPFRLTPEGSVATADTSEHIRQRVEQLLFTAPGERVMLPEFGSGVRDLVFAPNSPVLAAATEFTIARALQTFLPEVMINAVDVASEDETLRITVVYTRTATLQEERVVVRLSPFDRVSRV
jgi:phage baseplate assembly protein W